MDDFLLKGYEDLEISTQLILKVAISRKIEWEILDRPENFIRFKINGNWEYIKEASKTKFDSYMTFLAMENKTVSKVILEEANIRVPKGRSFHDKEDAKASFLEFQHIKKVIKPVTTNFGIGIEISDINEDVDLYSKRIERSFQYASSIIIEEFLEGPEYRFLVIAGKVAAVCNRVPANVCGDGIHTISELVDIKNQDIRRGTGHTTPLEKIQKSGIEEEILKSQKLNWDTIPAKDLVIYLRRNSNISTGGDSIDFTDMVHKEYFSIAERAAESVGAVICGVDIISGSITEKPREDSYGVLEINFNPVLYIHDYPFKGQNRKVAEKILDLYL
ncbi:MAG: bifunctional glutamate--cysteine ligase GshA/glutathione synthetase GshB [Leptospira sp.]|nr:bifunctional glutamate--cysteine ligase GshA/glutathione synthetase GshB [Leptospira sp.]